MDPMNTVTDIMTPYQTCKIAQKIDLSETCKKNCNELTNSNILYIKTM